MASPTGGEESPLLGSSPPEEQGEVTFAPHPRALTGGTTKKRRPQRTRSTEHIPADYLLRFKTPLVDEDSDLSTPPASPGGGGEIPFVAAASPPRTQLQATKSFSNVLSPLRQKSEGGLVGLSEDGGGRKVGFESEGDSSAWAGAAGGGGGLQSVTSAPIGVPGAAYRRSSVSTLSIPGALDENGPSEHPPPSPSQGGSGLDDTALPNPLAALASEAAAGGYPTVRGWDARAPPRDPDDPEPLSLYGYLATELGVELKLKPGGQVDDKTKKIGQLERERVYNTLLYVPWQLERLLYYGLLLCMDGILSIFTFLPLRCLHFAWKLLTHRNGWRDTEDPVLSPSAICDVLWIVLVAVGVAVTSTQDVSIIYHYIRGQEVIKLYMWFNLLEVFDRVCSSFGTDSLESLTQTAMRFAHMVLGLDRDGKDPNAAAAGGGGGGGRGEGLARGWGGGGAGGMPSPARSPTPAGRGFGGGAGTPGGLFGGAGGGVLGGYSRGVMRESVSVCCDLGIAMAVVVFHSLVLIVQATTINVAINSSNNALLSLLISNNFVEIKGNIFKKMDVHKLFELSCRDICERFHILVLLVFVAMEMLMKSDDYEIVNRMVNMFALVLVIEVVVDILKHSFLGKFNEVKPGVYSEFLRDLCMNAASGQSHNTHRLVGFEPLAPTVVLIRALMPLGRIFLERLRESESGGRATLIAKVGLGFGAMVLMKVLLGLLVRFIGLKYLRYYNRKHKSLIRKRPAWG